MTGLIPVLAFLSMSAAPVRIGYGHSAPYCYTQRDGRPGGFMVEVFEEAARREGLALAWTRAGSVEENDRAFRDGRLDLLPMSVAQGERKRLLFVTEPWWSEETILLVRGDRPGIDAAHPSRLALPRVLAEGAGRHYPQAKQVMAPSASTALEHVCRNTADAALMGATYIRDLVNARPAACEAVPLRILDSPVTADLTLIARWQAKDAAERLRRQLTEMTLDGTLVSIAGRHPPISSPHVTRMSEELRFRHEAHRLRTLLVTISLFLIAGVAVLAHQIRLRRTLQATIAKQFSTERELRSSQSELSRRTEDLARSNEDLQAFAYSVSHDLQEPLRNQALFSELLLRRYAPALPGEASEFLRVIRSSALRSQEMMKSVLTYSRAGQADSPKSLISCTTVVERVLADLRPAIADAGARLDVGPLPSVWGWEDRLQQVFQNLIGNAVKYRRPGVPPVVTVSAVQDGAVWRFAVSDNGVGFSPEYAGQVFGLFKRLHTQAQYSGSGIGLALCKRVVERHGGRIWAESREGEGSTFYFTIPVEAGQTEPERKQLQVAAS